MGSRDPDHAHSWFLTVLLFFVENVFRLKQYSHCARHRTTSYGVIVSYDVVRSVNTALDSFVVCQASDASNVLTL